MNEARWTNIARSRKSYTTGNTWANGRPLEAFFEISARCNLRCQMCAINYDERYKPSAHRRAFFEPDLFAKLRPIFPTLYRASLFGLGEPMLNRQ
jgi:MoaA/NifB/PqqE/SkfB family radical SAM enzyme